AAGAGAAAGSSAVCSGLLSSLASEAGRSALSSEDFAAASFFKEGFDLDFACCELFSRSEPQHTVAVAVQVCSSKTMRLRNSSQLTSFLPTEYFSMPCSAAQ